MGTVVSCEVSPFGLATQISGAAGAMCSMNAIQRAKNVKVIKSSLSLFR